MIRVLYNKISAFSLIEIAIALTVAGLLMAGVIEATRVAVVSGPINTTRENFEDIEDAMQKFLAMHGRYPCPARPELNPTDSGAGVEICDLDSFNEYSLLRDADGDDVDDDGWIDKTVFPTCNDKNDTDSGSGYCYVLNDGRDANSDGSSSDDKIIQGGVPYKTLGLLSKTSEDGWDIALRYVVSEKAINADTYDKDMGSIYVVNSINIDDTVNNVVNYRGATPDADFNKTYPAVYGGAQYVLLSSGKNRAGAYIYSGASKLVGIDRIKYECGAGEDSEVSSERKNFGLDFENCNQDAYFLSDDRFAVLDENNIEYYLDDIVHDSFSLTPYSDGMWRFGGDLSGTLFSTSIVNEYGNARVGIGTDVPAAALDINGNLKTDNISSKELCDGSNCINLSFIVSNAKCSGGLIVSLDAASGYLCLNTTFTNLKQELSCGDGQVMSGFVPAGPAAGNVICRNE